MKVDGTFREKSVQHTETRFLPYMGLDFRRCLVRLLFLLLDVFSGEKPANFGLDFRCGAILRRAIVGVERVPDRMASKNYRVLWRGGGITFGPSCYPFVLIDRPKRGD